MLLSAAAKASNTLTRNWLQTIQGNSSVSGLGALLALAMLEAGGDQTTSQEISEALGLDVGQAMNAAHALHELLQSAQGISANAAIWVNPKININKNWLEEVKPLHVGHLDQIALDQWADENTKGMIKKFPLEINPDSLLVLATLLMCDVTWVDAFGDYTPTVQEGPWKGQKITQLSAFSKSISRLGVVIGDNPILTVRWPTKQGVDVYLMLGPENLTPAEILPQTLWAIETDKVRPITHRDQLDGVTVTEVRANNPGDEMYLSLPAFTVEAKHNLLEHPQMFGLQTAIDSTHGHFPKISAQPPLYVSQAVQALKAEFTAEGFRAAVITAMDMLAGSARPKEKYRVTHYNVSLNRPFGYAAIHHDSGLVLIAGWVDQPSSVPLSPYGNESISIPKRDGSSYRRSMENQAMTPPPLTLPLPD